MANPSKSISGKIQRYERTMPQIEYTYTCGRCNNSVTVLLYPGGKPTLCVDCKVEYRRERDRKRMGEYRASKKAQVNSSTL